MKNKVYWGLGVLIVLFIGVFVLMMVKHQAENQKLKDQLVEAQKLEDKIEQQKKLKNPPRAAKEGFKMVQHGDHWHEVPIIEQPTPIEQVAPLPKTEKVEPKTYDTILTYDEELLRTNPVEALRREAEARGHWSTKYIPPFPPDDLEAQAYARAIYYSTYLPTDDPRWDEGIKHVIIFTHEKLLHEEWTNRKADLLRIPWVDKDQITPRAQLLDMGLSERTDYPIKH